MQNERAIQEPFLSQKIKFKKVLFLLISLCFSKKKGVWGQLSPAGVQGTESLLGFGATPQGLKKKS